VSSEVFAAVWLKILFFWDMTLFLTRSLDPKILSQHISRIFSVQNIQEENLSYLQKIYSSKKPHPWKWRHYINLKAVTSTTQCNITQYKTSQH